MALLARKHTPIMCLTQDGLAWSHVEQAQRLCAGGTGWIQLRMKDAAPSFWLSTARQVAKICHASGTTFIVNDSVDVAIESGADGVHLGTNDLDWTQARRRLGPDRILGGTINNLEDVARARDAGCLDYVGVGPWRFTSNKKKLAPILGKNGVQQLVRELRELPAWVIGGIECADIPEVYTTEASGVAASSALFRNGQIEENLRRFQNAWNSCSGRSPGDSISVPNGFSVSAGITTS